MFSIGVGLMEEVIGEEGSTLNNENQENSENNFPLEMVINSVPCVLTLGIVKLLVLWERNPSFFRDRLSFFSVDHLNDHKYEQNNSLQ